MPYLLIPLFDKIHTYKRTQPYLCFVYRLARLVTTSWCFRWPWLDSDHLFQNIIMTHHCPPAPRWSTRPCRQAYTDFCYSRNVNLEMLRWLMLVTGAQIWNKSSMMINVSHRISDLLLIFVFAGGFGLRKVGRNNGWMWWISFLMVFLIFRWWFCFVVGGFSGLGVVMVVCRWWWCGDFNF